MEATMLNSIAVSTLNDQFQQFKQIKEKLIRENEELFNQVDTEKKNLDAIEQYIKETSDKIDLMNEEKNRTEIELKLEELKQKACSDETIKFMDILVKEIEYETNIYKQKNQNYLEENNIDLKLNNDCDKTKLNQETKAINITFLNNEQIEIVVKMDPTTKKFKVSCEKLSDELIELCKRDEMFKLLKQFNDGSSNLKQLILNIRDILYN